MQNTYRHTQHFKNGYSASIVSTPHSYGGLSGLFEMAVLHDEQIVYDTPVTNDVSGYLSFGEVAETLEKIEALPPRNQPLTKED
jgi:hypothetical protein